MVAMQETYHFRLWVAAIVLALFLFFLSDEGRRPMSDRMWKTVLACCAILFVVMVFPYVRDNMGLVWRNTSWPFKSDLIWPIAVFGVTAGAIAGLTWLATYSHMTSRFTADGGIGDSDSTSKGGRDYVAQMEEYASNVFQFRLDREMGQGNAEYSFEQALNEAKKGTSDDKVALLVASIKLLTDRIREPVKDRTALDDWMIKFHFERKAIKRAYSLVSANSKQFKKLAFSENDIPASEHNEAQHAYNALHERQLGWASYLIKQLTQARELVETTNDPPGIGLRITEIKLGEVVANRDKSVVAIGLVATNSGPESTASNWQLEVIQGARSVSTEWLTGSDEWSPNVSWAVVGEPTSTDLYFDERLEDEYKPAELKRISEQTQRPIPTGDVKVGYLVGLVDGERIYRTENEEFKIVSLRISFMDISGHQKQYLYDSDTETFHRIK